ncbi:asparagine--tRNA ligase, cytoplasmic-like [Bombus fervidus]|uniref:asparagine--tRNA ligase, cytoplasmic-like n=1 Tax=Bombus fervidus TaxID=203811 RepID=UPI003D18870C
MLAMEFSESLLERESFPPIYQDSHEDGKKFEIISKSQFKKAQKIWARKEYKNEDKRKKLLEDEEKRSKNLEEAKTIVIQEDSTLSPAIYVKIRDSINHRDRRVKLFGT